MSDRIDELVAAIIYELLQWDGKDVALEAAHELATIARKAEAERDALLAEHEAIKEVKPLTMDATIYHDAALFSPTITPRG